MLKWPSNIEFYAYKVIKSFGYPNKHDFSDTDRNILIKKGEILQMYIIADQRASGGVFAGFKRDYGHKPVKIKTGNFIRDLVTPTYRSEYNYNAHYVPKECVEKIK